MPFIDPGKLQIARLRAGLSREQAAIGIDRSYLTIRAYEQGVSIPPGDILVRLARLYGCAVEDLCHGETPAGAR